MPQITALAHRAVIQISGPDWATFLKGLCTAHIDEIVEEVRQGQFHKLHYGAFLRPQGKMICDCLLQAVAVDEIWLDVPLNAREELVSKLNMYKLRAKVTIAKRDNPVYVAFGADLVEGFSPDPRSVIVGVPFGLAYTPNRETASLKDWQAFRYALALSDPGFDFGADELYAIDANLDFLQAIDFHKGCYVGQELTSRMKRRGQIKNRILGLRHEGALNPGSEILVGELRAGEVLASVPGVSLGLMRLDRLEGALSSESVRLEVILPDWISSQLPATAQRDI